LNSKISKNNTTIGKALALNQDPQVYGAFAEIGAGQEVARLFFQAGHASQTIAKTISAYDMIYSDEIYGKETSGRYVCESRLDKMLNKEFSLLERRLKSTRGDRTTFFALANTVATGDQSKRYSHGWMGVRFQSRPGGEYNDIVIHLRMMDKHRLQQQEALGILGVNLVYAAFHAIENPDSLILSLVDNIKVGQISIDLIKFKGPDLAHINGHLMNLELVRRGLSEAILFGPDKSILNISDELYGKSLIVQRGTFRPVTNTHLDLLNKGSYQFEQDFPEDSKKTLVLFELTMQNLMQNTSQGGPQAVSQDGDINEPDFLDRVNSLCTLGGHVLVSNFTLFYKMKRYLRQYTSKPMVLIVSASRLQGLFDGTHYKDLEGGLLEGMGKLLDSQTRLYIYPHKTPESCLTAKTFNPDGEMNLIYQYFIKQQMIADISGCDQIEEFIHSDQVTTWIKEKNPKWEKHVPNLVKALIKEQRLFGLI
jgi:hypothetical protein